MRLSDSFRLFTSWLFLLQGDVCDLLNLKRLMHLDAVDHFIPYKNRNNCATHLQTGIILRNSFATFLFYATHLQKFNLPKSPKVLYLLRL
jgi:hypothetical protein